ncbi:MAG: arylsulfatase [Rikenellaceae bacterium]
MTTKKLFLGSAALLSCVPLVGCGGSAESTAVKAPAERPNVIFILADDLGIGDLGCYGQEQIKTPAIDSLAANGIKFTQHYSGSTVSAPSRCVLMTGKHTGHSFIRGNKGYKAEDGRGYDLNLAPEEVTVAEMFKTEDYKTACVGKWGLGGPQAEGHPNRQGFDYFFGYLGQGNAHRYYPTQLFENDDVVPLNKEVYTHDLILTKALDFIDKNSEENFFLYFTPTIPHADLILPEGEDNEYDGQFFETPFPGDGYTARENPRATFAGMVSRLDNGVSQIVELLKEKGIYDNTIIIFSSDNGTHCEGGHDPNYFDSNGPYRGNKRDLYEGGVRTPFIVQWPAVITEPRGSLHQGAFWDFMPTMCEMLGVDAPQGIDGVSYLPTLLGDDKNQKQHDYLYFEFHEQGGKQSVMKDGWKLISLNVNNPDEQYYELYNYYMDPAENTNVAAQYPERVAEMSKIIAGARTSNANWEFGVQPQRPARPKK